MFISAHIQIRWLKYLSASVSLVLYHQESSAEFRQVKDCCLPGWVKALLQKSKLQDLGVMEGEFSHFQLCWASLPCHSGVVCVQGLICHTPVGDFTGSTVKAPGSSRKSEQPPTKQDGKRVGLSQGHRSDTETRREMAGCISIAYSMSSLSFSVSLYFFLK